MSKNQYYEAKLKLDCLKLAMLIRPIDLTGDLEIQGKQLKEKSQLLYDDITADWSVTSKDFICTGIDNGSCH